jgi:hypothetical protein
METDEEFRRVDSPDRRANGGMWIPPSHSEPSGGANQGASSSTPEPSAPGGGASSSTNAVDEAFYERVRALLEDLGEIAGTAFKARFV